MALANSGPYQGYYHREVPEADYELTRVGPGTPGGEYLSVRPAATPEADHELLQGILNQYVARSQGGRPSPPLSQWGN